jgi:hypothetical protein
MVAANAVPFSIEADDVWVVLAGLSSRAGLSNWVFIVRTADVVLLDVGVGASVLAGIKAGTGVDFGGRLGGDVKTRAGLVVFCEEARRKAKAVEVVSDAAIEGIRLHLNLGAHQLVLCGPGGERTFAFMNREDPQAAQEALAIRFASRFQVVRSAPFGFLRRYAPFLTT